MAAASVIMCVCVRVADIFVVGLTCASQYVGTGHTLHVATLPVVQVVASFQIFSFEADSQSMCGQNVCALKWVAAVFLR